jgi:uncharacterized membrane protein
METKSIFSSKVFWLNLIIGIISVLGLVNPELLSAIGIKDPVQFMTIVGAVTAILNVILRFLTNQPITPIGKKKE